MCIENYRDGESNLIRLFNAYQLKKEHTLQMDTYTFLYKKPFLLI